MVKACIECGNHEKDKYGNQACKYYADCVYHKQRNWRPSDD